MTAKGKEKEILVINNYYYNYLKLLQLVLFVNKSDIFPENVPKMKKECFKMEADVLFVEA